MPLRITSVTCLPAVQSIIYTGVKKMKNKVITDTGLANSYIDNFYFYSKLSEIKINTSIDLIVLSCMCDDFQALGNELRKYYDSQEGPWLPEGKFQRKTIYLNDTDTIDLLHLFMDSETGYSRSWVLSLPTHKSYLRTE
jgi:hypothetical protein